MELRKLISIFAVSLAISACGGGGSSDSGSSSVSASAADGIYFGSGNEDGFGGFEILGFVDRGQLYAISDTGVGYTGTLNLQNENDYSTSLTLYDVDYARFDSASMSGNYTPDDSISGTYTRASGPKGSFSIDYLPEVYGRPVSTDLISGTWDVTNATTTTTITFDTNGNITGQNTDGCVYSGSISVPDESVNMFRVSLLIESCGQSNGSYQGLAAIMSSNSNSNIIAFMSNSSTGFALDLSKQ